MPQQSLVFTNKVLSTQPLGLYGAIVRKSDGLKQINIDFYHHQIGRAREFLASQARQHHSFTETGVIIYEYFSQLIIYDLTQDKEIVELPAPTKLVNFFRGKGQLTTDNYPCDLDTTSLAWTVLRNVDENSIHLVIDEMLKYRNPEGILEVYFDSTRRRTDPVVCVNALSLLYKNGRGSDAAESLEWVVTVLENRAYVDGTRYYATAECFLYFFSRLLHQNKELFEKYSLLLRDRLTERVGMNGDSLAMAMRISACNFVGVRNELDLQILRAMQEPDGS